MQLHLVLTQRGGYARDDAPTPDVAGAFTDPETARIIALITSGRVHTVEVDQVAPGNRQSAVALGLKLPTA